MTDYAGRSINSKAIVSVNLASATASVFESDREVVSVSRTTIAAAAYACANDPALPLSGSQLLALNTAAAAAIGGNPGR